MGLSTHADHPRSISARPWRIYGVLLALATLTIALCSLDLGPAARAATLVIALLQAGLVLIGFMRAPSWGLTIFLGAIAYLALLASIIFSTDIGNRDTLFQEQARSLSSTRPVDVDAGNTAPGVELRSMVLRRNTVARVRRRPREEE